MALVAALAAGAFWLYGRSGDGDIARLRNALAEKETPETRRELARALRAAGRENEALVVYHGSLAKNGRHPLVLLEFARFLRAGSDHTQEAEKLLREAVADQPQFSEGLYELGSLLLETGRPREARPAIEAAITTGPTAAPWRAEAELALLEAIRAARAKD